MILPVALADKVPRVVGQRTMFPLLPTQRQTRPQMQRETGRTPLHLLQVRAPRQMLMLQVRARPLPLLLQVRARPLPLLQVRAPRQMLPRRRRLGGASMCISLELPRRHLRRPSCGARPLITGISIRGPSMVRPSSLR